VVVAGGGISKEGTREEILPGLLGTSGVCSVLSDRI